MSLFCRRNLDSDSRFAQSLCLTSDAPCRSSSAGTLPPVSGGEEGRCVAYQWLVGGARSDCSLRAPTVSAPPRSSCNRARLYAW